MKWLSRVMHGWGSASMGYPTLDPGADVRARVGSSRTESPHRDIPSDTIEWRWDGDGWARWSALSRQHDRTDVPVPHSLLESIGDERVEPGATFRLVDGSWQAVNERA
jgi:hypothetical protein